MINLAENLTYKDCSLIPVSSQEDLDYVVDVVFRREREHQSREDVLKFIQDCNYSLWLGKRGEVKQGFIAVFKISGILLLEAYKDNPKLSSLYSVRSGEKVIDWLKSKGEDLIYSYAYAEDKVVNTLIQLLKFTKVQELDVMGKSLNLYRRELICQ